jgi:uncharacterized SAM-binding protein YcdF (DUF218 family)
MYGVRHLISLLASPLPVALLTIIAAIIFRTYKRRTLAHGLLICAALVSYFGSISMVGAALLGPLERAYPPLDLKQLAPAVSYIVVLGSGYAPRDQIPITAALDEHGLVRIVEGIRLARLLGGARLIVSGGAPGGQAPPARGYAELARALGVPDAELIVSDRSLDTSAEAAAVTRLLGPTPFLLVTSAYHMPRAIRLMHRAGASPIPAPTGQRVAGAQHAFLRDLIPSSGGLQSTELALREYLGLAALTAGLD